MFYSNLGGETYIMVEDGESERDVLRAIVRASFELAKPENLSILSYKPDHLLTNEEADRLIIHPPRSYDGCVINMDFVEGRRCATVLKKELACTGSPTFVLYDSYFERFRGKPDVVLRGAVGILQEIKEETFSKSVQN
jgi:hypothetical protein